MPEEFQPNYQPGFVANVSGWFSHPFQPQGTAFQWVMFVGLIIIAAFLWQTVLIALTREI